MILGGKLPGKVGRCRFFITLMKDSLLTVFFFFCRNPAASLLSESMVSCDPLCGIAARKETMKLAGLRLHVIWTLPVFYYLGLHIIEIKNCTRVCLFSYLNLGKIERKNWARSVKRMRASFLLCSDISGITTKAPCEAALMDECHMRIEISDFVMRTFVLTLMKDSLLAVFFLYR